MRVAWARSNAFHASKPRPPGTSRATIRLKWAAVSPSDSTCICNHLRVIYLYMQLYARSDPRAKPVFVPTRRGSNLILALLCGAQFMLILDVAIVNVALPSMQRTLGLSAESIQSVVSGYALTFGGFLMLGGRLADVVGRGRMFVGGLVLFIAASMLGGFSQSGGMLITARVIQGFAGALVSPAALSLLTTTFKEGRERNRALGVWSAMAAGGASAGLILGGLLTQALSSRFTLFVNVPLRLAADLSFPRLAPQAASPRTARTRFLSP